MQGQLRFPTLAQEQTFDLPNAKPLNAESELPRQPLDPLEEIKAQLESQTEKLAALQNELTALQSNKQEKQAKGDNPLGFQGKWDHGLWFESNNKQFKANIGDRVEQDWVWFDNDSNLDPVLRRGEDGVVFRRARFTVPVACTTLSMDTPSSMRHPWTMLSFRTCGRRYAKFLCRGTSGPGTLKFPSG